MIRQRGIAVVLCLIVFMSIPAVSMALDLSLGAATWYAWWKMEQGDREETFDPALMYGPVLALGFTSRWSLSSIFLYGEFTLEEQEGDREIDRYDSDTAINFSINRYVKLFGGVKFMGYSMSNFTHRGAGPALGAGITLPLSESFFLLWNLSGMYLWGEHKRKGEDSQEVNSLYTEPGLNTNLSLAYYIESASTTITLGGRYQLFGIEWESERQTEMTNQFYGITFSAVYAFAL